MTLEQLQQRRAEILQELKAISSAAELAKRPFNDDERARIESLRAENETLKTQISKLEADAKTRDLIASLDTELSTPNPRRTAPDTLGGVGNPQEAWQQDPNRGFKTPNEYLMTVMQAARLQADGRPNSIDPRLKSLIGPQKLAAGADEAHGSSDPYGGFLLPKGFAPSLLTVGSEGDPTLGRTTMVPMDTASIDLPARVDKNHSNSVSGGLRVFRRHETDTSASSRMEFEQVTLKPSSLFGLSYASEEILAKSPISFVAILQSGFADEFSSKLLKEKLFGTGTGEYEGVVTAPCTVSQSKESGQAAATIVTENIDKMISRCWRYGQAIWMANHDTYPQLASLVRAVGTGGAPVSYFSRDANGNAMLQGRPLFFTEFAETVGTLGDIVLGVWSQYLEAELGGMGQAESIHVRFINHERTFKFWKECDGRCWWKTALTPNQSANTLSPFVTLAARA